MMPTTNPSVTVLVLNWNGEHLLTACLTPLVQQTYSNYQVMLIDNASTDRSLPLVRKHFPSVEIVQNDRNLGFAIGNNVGLRLVQARSADYAILLNTDVEVPLDWLATFVAEMQKIPNLGVAGCKLLFPNGQIQHLGGVVKLPQVVTEHPYQFEPDQNQITQVQDANYVTGAAFAISRRALDTVGVLNELFAPMYFEEVDYCYRVRAAGLGVVLLPSVTAIHDESATINRTGNRARMYYLNRLRFATQHVPIAQFGAGFVAAELERLAEATSAEIDLIRELCLQVVLELPRALPLDRPAVDLQILQQALLSLRDRLPQGQLAPPEQKPLREWQFSSTIPLVGQAISMLRRAWFNVAARWALKAALDEQRELNQRLIETQKGLLERQQGLEGLAGQLSAEVARLQQAQHQSKETD